jgi:hypothetical protein
MLIDLLISHNPALSLPSSLNPPAVRDEPKQVYERNLYRCTHMTALVKQQPREDLMLIETMAIC